MKAFRLKSPNGPTGITSADIDYDEVPQPRPGPAEVLIQVFAAGTTADELWWPTTWQTADGEDRSCPIPGHAVAGVIAEVGSEISQRFLGNAVFALTDFRRDGAAAEYAIARLNELAPVPRTVHMVQAASVPLAGLTAWQALFDHSAFSAGQTILVHGAASGIGTFAVQLAHWAGATVIASDLAQNDDLLHELGADDVIDAASDRVADAVHHADVVFDTIGDNAFETAIRSVNQDAVILVVASPPSREGGALQRARVESISVTPNPDQLGRIADLVDTGHVRPIIHMTFPLRRARLAYEVGGIIYGNIVLQVRE